MMTIYIGKLLKIWIKNDRKVDPIEKALFKNEYHNIYEKNLKSSQTFDTSENSKPLVSQFEEFRFDNYNLNI